MSDEITKPPHYTGGAIESIHAIEAAGNIEGFCLGNVMKYIWRHRHKGAPLADLKKAAWYLDYYIRHIESKAAHNNNNNNEVSND